MAEIITWIFSTFHIESAILGWKMAGKNWLFVLLAAEAVGAIGILISYGWLSIFFLFFKKVLRINFSPRSSKRPRRRKNKKTWIKRTKIRIMFWTRKRIKDPKHHQHHPFLILFLLNLIPFLPYITFSTIVAAKILRVRRGILAILIGNGAKILFLVLVIFRIM